MDPLRSVARGDRTGPPSATAHNATMEAVRAYQRRRLGVAAPVPVPRPTQEVLVRNSTGAQVPQFGVLSIDGVVITPAADNMHGIAPVVFEGRQPSPLRRNFVVLQVPLADGEVGPAVATGVTVVTLDVAAGQEALQFAEPAGGVLRPVESGQAEILWRAGGLGEQQAVVRLGNTPSSGLGASFVAVVVAPTSDASVASTYTVDIYGSTLASLADEEGPSVTGATAVQAPATNRFWLGEVVVVTQSGSGWTISKLLAHPIAYTATAGLIDLRLMSVNPTTPQATNFVVDLVDLLAWLNGGATEVIGYVAFNFASYFGIGRVSKLLSCPVRRTSGPRCTVLFVSTSSNATTALTSALAGYLTGTASTLSTSQDSWIAIPGTSFGVQVDTPTSALVDFRLPTYTVGSYRYFDAVLGENRSATTLQLRCDLLFYHSSGTAFPGLPARPTIPGGVDNANILLLAVRWQISVNNSQATGSAPNKAHPELVAVRPVPAGGMTWAGAYPVTFARALTDTEITWS